MNSREYANRSCHLYTNVEQDTRTSAGLLRWLLASEYKTLGCSTTTYGTPGGVSRDQASAALLLRHHFLHIDIFTYLDTLHDPSLPGGLVIPKRKYQKHESASSMPSIEPSPSRRSKISLCIPIDAQQLMKFVLIYLTLFTAAMSLVHHVLPDTQLQDQSLQGQKGEVSTPKVTNSYFDLSKFSLTFTHRHLNPSPPTPDPRFRV